MIRHILVVLFLGLLATLTPALAAQEGGATAAPAQLTAENCSELAPEVQHALVFSVGTPRLYQALQALLIETEFDRRKEAGLRVDFAEVTELDVEQRIQRTIGDFVDKNPDLDFWAQVDAAGFDEKSYREEIRRNLVLERLYFPPNFDDWPTDILKEVFGGEDEGSLWTSMISKMPEELQKQRDAGQPGEIHPTTMQVFLRPAIFGYLMDNAEIKYPFDGLPDGVALSVNGKEVQTVDLLKLFADVVSDVELQRARDWVDVVAKTRAALEAEGVLMSNEETLALVEEERKEYIGSVVTYEQIALEFMGFPSLELYHAYKQLRESYRKTLPDPYSEEVMDEHLKNRLNFIGNGQVTAEVILISAHDLDTGTWPQSGSWEAARKRSENVVRELLAEKPWNEVLSQYSEYPAKTRGSQPGMPQPQRGRFGSQMRNPLRQFIGENDYTDFLLGHSVADHIFFEAEKGAVYGPVEGVYGFYIYKLMSRSDPTKQPDWRNDERDAYFVRDDYLNVKFLEYVSGVMNR
ncbi:MAG: hypothetical protein CMJ94_15935 [Planctomycetes bacterium]|nr:hypothetical protein [Planctomycetota bacterium]